MKQDSSYNIINATVKSFNGSKYVSGHVNNIGVVDELTFDEIGGIVVVKAEVVWRLMPIV